MHAWAPQKCRCTELNALLTSFYISCLMRHHSGGVALSWLESRVIESDHERDFLTRCRIEFISN